MKQLSTIVVVGGSLAGIRSAEALRRRGYDGRLVFVGEEPERPYDRPPLSKEFLKGERELDKIQLTKPENFDALDLDLRLGKAASALEPAEKTVVLADGERIAYDGLVIATGAAARPLPNTPDLSGIHTLRTLGDSLAIRSAIEANPRVAVVGAGFIGAEVAATCRQRGLDVTMIEAMDSPMARVLNPTVGGVCAAAHRDEGVDVRLGVGVEALEGDKRIERVRLADGSVVEADLVVVGIGAIPSTRWLESSGLELDNGVVCDATCATQADGVVAAGDVARWHHEGYGESVRIEHWTNAIEQADAVAARLLDGPSTPAFVPVPFVWSDQFALKIQAAGTIRPDDDFFIAHGSLEERRFVALFGRGGKLCGALAMNRVQQLMSYRRMMREESSFDEAVAKAKEA